MNNFRTNIAKHNEAVKFYDEKGIVVGPYDFRKNMNVLLTKDLDQTGCPKILGYVDTKTMVEIKF